MALFDAYVSPSPSNNQILPGFDYVHALLGIPTRTYEETISMFKKSAFFIEKELAIPELPNTFLWILSPKHIKHGKKAYA